MNIGSFFVYFEQNCCICFLFVVYSVCKEQINEQTNIFLGGLGYVNCTRRK